MTKFITRRCVLLAVLIVTAAVVLSGWVSTAHSGNKPIGHSGNKHIGHSGNKLSGLNSLMKGYGFVLTLEYTGQLVAGVRAVLSQQCWIASFRLPLHIVEPFSNNSCLRQSPDTWRAADNSASTVVRFSDHYNLDHFNQQSRKFGNPVMKTWEEFLNTAPRRIILVTVEDIHRPGCLSYNKQACGLESEKEKMFNGCNISPNTVKSLDYLEKHDFHIVRKVCLNCMPVTSHVTPDHVTQHIFGHYNPRNVTLIINKWRFSMKIPRNCSEVDRCKNENDVLAELFMQSKRLERDANWYTTSYFQSKKIVAVMIRVEWYLITNRKNQRQEQNNVMECFDQVLSVVKDMKEKRRHSESIMPFLSIDVGSYGSGTFTQTMRHSNTSASTYAKILNQTKHLVEQMYSNFWTFEDWETSFLTIPKLPIDRGYIATLQSTIASKADCLILMGGGHFQQMTLQNYLQFHPLPEEQCVKYVCVARSFQKNFRTLV